LRIRILSDLDLNHQYWTPPRAEADIVLLAGNIADGRTALHWALDHFHGVPVIYVMGNIEYENASRPNLVESLFVLQKELLPEKGLPPGYHVRFYDEDAIEIQGVCFLGCTLWTDYRLLGPAQAEAAMRYASSNVAEFQRRIRCDAIAGPPGRDGYVTPNIAAATHRRSRAWLLRMLNDISADKIVILTHHAPSAQSLGGRKPELADASVASAMEHIVAESGAALWVHGHSHQAADYRIAGTRVVCNPRGYPNRDEGNGFDAGLVIEI
jgi:predicted phosphodiesterase